VSLARFLRNLQGLRTLPCMVSDSNLGIRSNGVMAV